MDTLHPAIASGFLNLIRQPVFQSAMMSWFIAQFAKAVINLFKSPSHSFKDVLVTFFWRTGGMPSSHSALAVSIATSIGFTSGVTSDVFILSLFFAMVVIRDAMGVRRASGLQAKALNSLGKDLTKKLKLSFHPVKEIHGHTLPQTLIGSLLGFFIALAVCTL